jgi:hypothetical protein
VQASAPANCLIGLCTAGTQAKYPWQILLSNPLSLPLSGWHYRQCFHTGIRTGKNLQWIIFVEDDLYAGNMNVMTKNSNAYYSEPEFTLWSTSHPNCRCFFWNARYNLQEKFIVHYPTTP